jgi:hypothetical protein
MDAIRDEYLAISAREEGLSARNIIRHHQHCIESLARPAYRRLFWGPMWLVGEAPKRSHVAACQSFSRLAQLWRRLQLRMPVEFRDLTERPMPKSYSRWGDMRPRRIDSALGARKLLREAIGLCGAVTSDLFVVLLGSTVREAFGAQRLDLYRWYCLPRSENVLGELFLASIPHPSPLASRVFDKFRVARLLDEVHSARVRRPKRSRGFRHVERLGLMPIDE